MTLLEEADKALRVVHALALWYEAQQLAEEMKQNPPMERRVEILERMCAIRDEIRREHE